MRSKKSKGLSGKKICWISFLILDSDLYKTSQIEVLHSLAARGYKASLFGVYSRERYQSERKDVKVISIPLRYVPLLSAFMYTLLLFIYLPLYFAYSQPDIVIVEPADPVFLSVVSATLFPKSKRPKIILDVRSTPVKKGHTQTLLFTTAVRVAKRLFDGMTIITPMMKKEICDRFHINPESVGVWTSGVSTASFNPENFDEAGLRKRHGLDHKFVVFYHGSLGDSLMYGQSRGIPASIKSMEILKKRSDLTLFLLGDGRSFHWIKKLVEECGVNDKVILHDKVKYEDVPAYIALSDVCLTPLPNLRIWRNQCPLKLLEYMAMEKVVIATDIPANRYIIGENECGVFIPSAEPEEIAKAIQYAYDNREKLKEWGASGRKTINEKFTWEKVADEFEEYFLRL